MAETEKNNTEGSMPAINLTGDTSGADASVEGTGLEASSGADGEAFDDDGVFDGDELDDARDGDQEAPALVEKAIAIDAWEGDAGFSGGELDESKPAAGTLEGDATDIAVDELESLVSFEEELPGDAASENDDAAPGDAGGADAMALNTAGDGGEASVRAAAPKEDGGRVAKKRKLVLPVVAGLSVLVLGGIGAWVLAPQGDKTVVPEVSKAVAPEQVLALEGFLIPYHREGRHYLSFGVSVEPSAMPVLQEIRLNREAIRGKIFDLMKTHIDRQTNTPTPAMVESIVEEGLDACLSTGRAGRVAITSFTFI